MRCVKCDTIDAGWTAATGRHPAQAATAANAADSDRDTESSFTSEFASPGRPHAVTSFQSESTSSRTSSGLHMAHRVLMPETNESRSKYCELEMCTSWCKAHPDESINMTSRKRFGTIDSEMIGGEPSGDIYTLHQDSVVQVVW